MPTSAAPRVGELAALYREFVKDVALSPAQELATRAALFGAQEAWLTADDQITARAARTAEPEAARIERAATVPPDTTEEDLPRSAATSTLVDRLASLLSPEQLARAQRHPFLTDFRHVETRLFVPAP